MNLQNYSIIKDGERTIIRFYNSELKTLESLLNSAINEVIEINWYLDQLYILKDNWPDIDKIVEKEHDYYWEEYTLKTENKSGHWFTLMNYPDIVIYVHKESKLIYFENGLLNQPIVEIPIDEFIDILEQWRVIQEKK